MTEDNLITPEQVEQFLKEEEEKRLQQVLTHLRAIHDLGYGLEGKIQITGDGRLTVSVKLVKRQQ